MKAIWRAFHQVIHSSLVKLTFVLRYNSNQRTKSRTNLQTLHSLDTICIYRTGLFTPTWNIIRRTGYGKSSFLPWACQQVVISQLYCWSVDFQLKIIPWCISYPLIFLHSIGTLYLLLFSSTSFHLDVCPEFISRSDSF